MATEDKTRQELEEETHTLRNVINELRSEKAKVEKKNEDLRRIHIRQENRNNQLCREIDELKADNNDLNTINSTLYDNLAAMDANVEQWEKYASEGTDQLSKLNLYTDEVKRQLKSKEAEVAELDARLKILQACNNDLTERNENLEERLVTKKIKAQAFKAEYDELERKHEALWKTVDYLDEIVEEDQNEVMRLRQGILYLKKVWESYEQQ
ncbi:hypothetical protein KCU91_g15458, partial [Aureobasidium melanogenum]